MKTRVWGFVLVVTLSGCAFVPLVRAVKMEIPGLPQCSTVSDPTVEAYAASLMMRILAVTSHAYLADRYTLLLADLRQCGGFAGVSSGGGTIYLDAGWARSAFKTRQLVETYVLMILAHEIGHEIAGHARQVKSDSYAPDRRGRVAARELEADRLAIGYWKTLGWPCLTWVRRFEKDIAHGDRGTWHHPTPDRLDQAKRLCSIGDSGA